MRSEIRFFINFFIWGIVSLIFVFAGKYNSELTYLFGLFMYTHLFWSHIYDIERIERRFKRYKAKCRQALNEAYGIGSADRTDDMDNDSEV